MASNDTEIGKNGEKMQIFRQMNPYNSKTIEGITLEDHCL